MKKKIWTLLDKKKFGYFWKKKIWTLLDKKIFGHFWKKYFWTFLEKNFLDTFGKKKNLDTFLFPPFGTFFFRTR